MITHLAEDTDSRVRSYVASSIGLLCRYMGRPWSTAILDIMFTYFRDENETVRAASVQSVPATARALVSGALARLSAGELSPIVNNAHSDDPYYIAASSIKLFESFIPAVTGLGKDASVLVRGTLSGMLPDLLTYLWPPVAGFNPTSMDGRAPDNTYVTKLVNAIAPIMLKLLGDSVVQVSVQMLSALSVTAEADRQDWAALVFSGDRTKEILQYLSPLAKHHNWRSRHAICVMLPLLAAACNSVEGRAKVASIAVPLIKDSVFEVRKCATRAICLAGRCDLLSVSSDAVTTDGEPVQDMGRMWLDGIVLPQLHNMHQSKNYADRILSLHMIAVILTEKVVERDGGRVTMLLDIALSLDTDKVANVRLALAYVLLSTEKFYRGFVDKVRGRLISTLERLGADRDKDVAHFGRSALKAVLGDDQTPEDTVAGDLKETVI